MDSDEEDPNEHMGFKQNGSNPDKKGYFIGARGESVWLLIY